MRDPWDKPQNNLNWRFGAKIDTNKIGFAAVGVRLGATRPDIASGSETGFGDPVGKLITEYKKAKHRDPQCDGVVLYEYATEEAFYGSRGWKDGMTLREHTRSIDRAKERLRAAGIDVIVQKVLGP